MSSLALFKLCLLAYIAIGLWVVNGSEVSSPAPNFFGFVVKLLLAYLILLCWPLLLGIAYVMKWNENRNHAE